MTDQSLNSLIDLVRLTRRYSAEDWVNLVRILENEDSRKDLIDAAWALSSAAGKEIAIKRSPRARIPTKRVPLLKELERVDPEKALILKEFRNGVAHGHFLRSINQIRDFASAWGMKLPEGTSRERTLNELIRLMSTMPKNEIESRLKNIPTDRDYGRDYDNWVRIIMGEKNKQALSKT